MGSLEGGDTLDINATAPNDISTLSLHDALPISAPGAQRQLPALDHRADRAAPRHRPRELARGALRHAGRRHRRRHRPGDRKSTRLNSSHVENSYAVFCVKKKKNIRMRITRPVTL